MKVKQTSLFIAVILSVAAFTGCGKPSNPDIPSDEITTIYDNPISSENYAEISDDAIYKEYYFDSENGNDLNDGTKLSPKKSMLEAKSIISKVKEEEPTKILFKAGSEYSGTFYIEDFAANEETPLIVDVYDETEANKYVKFIAPSGGDAVVIRNGNARISGLECTGVTGYRGIHILTKKAGALKNLVISGNYIHDINFNLGNLEIPEDGSTFDLATVKEICSNNRFLHTLGGIIVEAETSKAVGPSWYENLWIENNFIEQVARVGIWVFSNWSYRPGITWGVNPYYNDEIGWYPHSKVYIRDNFTNYTGGDGIILGATIGGIIERNTTYHAQFLGRAGYPSAGIWTHSCKDTVIQYNEAAFTHTEYDGQGFDIDIGNSNILFQYNYSHHNVGGGLLCCNTTSDVVQYDVNGERIDDEEGVPVMVRTLGDWHDAIIRNNVFADNGVADLILSGKVDKVRFENNTVICPDNPVEKKYRMIDTKDFNGTNSPALDWKLTNNIFYMRTPQKLRNDMNLSFTIPGRWKCDNNIFYGFEEDFYTNLGSHSEVSNMLRINPEFESNIAEKGYENAKKLFPKNLKIKSGGSKLNSANKFDFNGTSVEGIQYYGATVLVG